MDVANQILDLVPRVIGHEKEKALCKALEENFFQTYSMQLITAMQKSKTYIKWRDNVRPETIKRNVIPRSHAIVLEEELLQEQSIQYILLRTNEGILRFKPENSMSVLGGAMYSQIVVDLEDYHDCSAYDDICKMYEEFKPSMAERTRVSEKIKDEMTALESMCNGPDEMVYVCPSLESILGMPKTLPEDVAKKLNKVSKQADFSATNRIMTAKALLEE